MVMPRQAITYYVRSICLIALQLNRVVMTVIFFIPLSVIALYEVSSVDKPWLVRWLRSGLDEGNADDPVTRDPQVEGPDAERGLQISKVKFSELVRHFPNTEQVSGYAECRGGHPANNAPVK